MQATHHFHGFRRRRNLGATQGTFSAAGLHLTKLTDWPWIKSKAVNCAILCEWLWDIYSTLGPGRVRDLIRCTLHGFIGCYTMHTYRGFELSSEQCRKLNVFRECMLLGYNALAQHFKSLVPAIPLFSCRPKYHQLDHLLRRCCATKLSPYVTLCLNDESIAGDISKLAHGTHPRSMGFRTIQR